MGRHRFRRRRGLSTAGEIKSPTRSDRLAKRTCPRHPASEASQDKRVTERHGHVDVFLSMPNMRGQAFSIVKIWSVPRVSCVPGKAVPGLLLTAGIADSTCNAIFSD